MLPVPSYSVSTSQGNVKVWDSGDKKKPAVLFIHGNSASSKAFSKQFVSPLIDKYRLIALDLLGHGASDQAKDPQSTYNYEGYAHITKEVLQQMNLENPVVVGWSLGGHIGIALMKIYKLAGLLITGTPPSTIEEGGIQKGFNPMPAIVDLFTKTKFTREDAARFMSHGGFDVEVDDFIVDDAFNADGQFRLENSNWKKAHVGYSQKEMVESDDTPICVVHGEEDKGIDCPHIQSIQFKNLFQNKVHVIPNGRHAVFRQCSEEFNPIMGAFLESVF